MFDLDQLRREKWRLDGRPVRTLEEAREFIESVGFCLMYPLKAPVLAPTFIGAWVGSEERLPTWQHAYADPRAHEATDLMVRLLRERAAYEANPFDENNGFLVAGSIFPYFYALVGERNPKHAPHGRARAPNIHSWRAMDTRSSAALAPSPSRNCWRRWAGELRRRRSTSRWRSCGRDCGSRVWTTARWRVRPGMLLYRWSPDAVREGISLSVAEALSALLSKYLDCVVAADQQEVEAFFGNFVPRSRVRESINALLAARELSFVHVGNRSLIQITPAKVPVEHEHPRRAGRA